MKATVLTDTIVKFIKLPTGFRFKEWEPTSFFSVSSWTDNGRLTTFTMAIERISDGRYVPIEIVSLSEMSKLTEVSLVSIAHGIDQSIAEMKVEFLRSNESASV